MESRAIHDNPGPTSRTDMVYELAMFPELDREVEAADLLRRSRRALRVFLAASFVAHVAIIIGWPAFMPGYPAIGASTLEVTLLGPQPAPAAVAQAQPLPEPALNQPEPQPAPRPEPQKPQVVQEAAKPAAGGAALGTPLPGQDPEIVGSFSVAPSRGLAPLAAVPDAASEAASLQMTPPSFDAAYLKNPKPLYPPAAHRAGERGTVMLRVLVLRDGLPSRVEIDKSSGSRLLDTAARDAVWGWRFVPARLGTDPIESWMQVPVTFRLEDAR
jgi:protein TonB